MQKVNTFEKALLAVYWALTDAEARPLCPELMVLRDVPVVTWAFVLVAPHKTGHAQEATIVKMKWYVQERAKPGSEGVHQLHELLVAGTQTPLMRMKGPNTRPLGFPVTSVTSNNGQMDQAPAESRSLSVTQKTTLTFHPAEVQWVKTDLVIRTPADQQVFSYFARFSSKWIFSIKSCTPTAQGAIHFRHSKHHSFYPYAP